MGNNKPLVNAAFACENVLAEVDGVNYAIRIVDTYRVQAFAADGKTELSIPEGHAIPIAALIVLKSGDFKGEGELSVVVCTPDGKRTPIPEKWKMIFTGGEHGNNLVMRFHFAAKHVGLTWVEVLWNDEALTRFPIKLAQGQTPSQAH
jgi:hypothetical protein